ncbi:CapA family protein [Halalkalibacter alkalisediminis]|uniref:CapA family protein n=1 Tax=Halalkalibacter alkalisediminis TaxID=935616 RepID=A0ABV6NJT4_9BACI|nr:CapA family protein [Halalkalibacter alkalisediminis]
MKRMLMFLILMVTFTACQQEQEEAVKEMVDPPLIDAEMIEIEEEEVNITIGSIGDVLLHSRVYKKAQTEDGYDFLPMLERVEPLLQAPDFMMANQESMPGGVELGLSTYPNFNSPHEIASNLQTVGIDMVIGANNHTLDRGVEAVESALDYYDEINMEYVGVYRDTKDRERERIVTVDDVTIGVLAYTYGTNGIPIPAGHEDMVALIDPERMDKDIERLRAQVDVLIVHMHWGAEYENEPNEEQRELAEQLSEAGVDIIFGHHPHVLQPIEVIEQESGHETTVFYSLGNFISSQDFGLTDIGGVATVEVTKTTKGDDVSIDIHTPHIEPTLVEQGTYRVYPFAETDINPIMGGTYTETIEHTERYLTE